MLTKNILLLSGALAVLSVGVVGVNAYLSKKPIPVVELPKKEVLEESTSTKPEEFTSTELKEINSSSEIDISNCKTSKIPMRHPFNKLKRRIEQREEEEWPVKS